MKKLLLILLFTLGLTTTANAVSKKYACNVDNGDYAFFLSFELETGLVTRKDTTWQFRHTRSHLIWLEVDDEEGSSSMWVFDPFRSLVHYKSMHVSEEAGMYGSSGATIVCQGIK